MDELTEGEWRHAERREPGKTYVEPELAPLHRYIMGRGAIVIWAVAIVLATGMIWSALPLIPVAVDGWNGFSMTVHEIAAGAGWPRD